MDKLVCITTFVRVAEAGSFAAVADVMGLTPAMVGRQVRALEDHLGTRLLTRTTRRHSLTETGQLYLDRARVILAELAAADDGVAMMRAAPRGLLRIDAPVSFGSTCLAPALADFLASNPEIRVELTLNNRVVDLLEEGYDAVIRTGDLPDSGLVSRSLAPYPLLACAAPLYLNRTGEPTDLDDLEHHSCLRFRPGALHDVWTFVDAAGAAKSIKVSGPLATNNGHALRAAAIAGAGITLQAASLLREDVDAGRLRIVLPKLTPRPLPMHVLYPAGHSIAPKLRSFISFVAERFTNRK